MPELWSRSAKVQVAGFYLVRKCSCGPSSSYLLTPWCWVANGLGGGCAVDGRRVRSASVDRVFCKAVALKRDADCESVWLLRRDGCEFGVHEVLSEWCASAAVSMSLQTRLI